MSSNEELAIGIQGGNTALYGELWCQTKWLWIKMVNAFSQRNGEQLTRHGLTVEDLQQVAFLALVFAVRQYRPEKGLLLTSYFNFALKQEINAAFGGGKRKSKIDALAHGAELDAPISEDSETTLGDLLPDPFDMEETTNAILERETLWAAVERLPETHAAIIKEHYRNDMPLKKVAAGQGLSYPKTQAEHDKALRRLRGDQTLCDVFADRINFYGGTGLSQFKHTGASSVEWSVELLERIAQIEEGLEPDQALLREPKAQREKSNDTEAAERIQKSHDGNCFAK